MNWRNRLIERDDEIADLLMATRRIAVLGVKTEAAADEPAFYVAKYLVDAGFDVIPVPVYYPQATMILNRPVYRSLKAIPGSVDLVDVFRRSEALPGHIDDVLAARPGAVWFQLGIRNDAVAETLAKAGIRVVQDRCLMVEHRRLAKFQTLR